MRKHITNAKEILPTSYKMNKIYEDSVQTLLLQDESIECHGAHTADGDSPQYVC